MNIDVWVKFVDAGPDPNAPSYRLGLQMYPIPERVGASITLSQLVPGKFGVVYVLFSVVVVYVM